METYLTYSLDLDESQLTEKEEYQCDMVDTAIRLKIMGIEERHNCKGKQETLLYFPPQGESECLTLEMGMHDYHLWLKVVEKDEKHAVLAGELEDGSKIRIILE